jgi:hypothetical protein
MASSVSRSAILLKEDKGCGLKSVTSGSFAFA